MKSTYVGEEVVVSGTAGVGIVTKIFPNGKVLLNGPYLSDRSEADRTFSVSELDVPPRECHYCGAPATGWGFFSEPICRNC
jgi:hypothetical protein